MLQLNFQDIYRQADHIIPGLHLDMRERAVEGCSPLPETGLYHTCLGMGSCMIPPPKFLNAHTKPLLLNFFLDECL